MVFVASGVLFNGGLHITSNPTSPLIGMKHERNQWNSKSLFTIFFRNNLGYIRQCLVNDHNENQTCNKIYRNFEQNFI